MQKFRSTILYTNIAGLANDIMNKNFYRTKTALKYVTLACFVLNLAACVTVEKYNHRIGQTKSVEKLRADVDYVRIKLEKYHPDLYKYIEKESFNRKLDSLKESIVSPLTSNQFYYKISPVIASIGQGHIRIYQLNKKFTKEERKSYHKNKILNPFAKYSFDYRDDKLYVKKGFETDSTLRKGYEIIEANHININDLLKKYKPTIGSDGYNTTFQPRSMAKEFPKIFFIENGYTEKVSCLVKTGDTLLNINLLSQNDTVQKVKPQKNSKTLKNQSKKQDDPSKPYNLSFQDSSIATMRLKSFSGNRFYQFYKKSFEELNKRHTQNLILDLRDNYGGSLNNSIKLYSYLTDTPFQFTEKYRLKKRESLLIPLFNSPTLLGKFLIFTIGLPSRIIALGVINAKTHKNNEGGYFFNSKLTKFQKPEKQNFKGNVYVLVNGASFSATCLLSANLKSTNRAVFIGEETGGAFNGCVAGSMPFYTLPGSKLKFKFGLIDIRTWNKTQVIGHGIYPDFEIIPTLNDLTTGTDPEMNKALELIKIQKQENKTKN